MYGWNNVHALGDLCTVVGKNSYAARRIGNVLEKAHAVFAVVFLAPPPTPPPLKPPPVVGKSGWIHRSTLERWFFKANKGLILIVTLYFNGALIS